MIEINKGKQEVTIRRLDMNLLNRYAKIERDYSYGYGIAVFGIIVIIFGIFAFYVVNVRIDYPTT